MATMSLVLTREEFDRLISNLQGRGSRKYLLDVTGKEGIRKNEMPRALVDFLHCFMIDMNLEEELGLEYSLVIDGKVIPLDSRDSDDELVELVRSCLPQ